MDEFVFGVMISIVIYVILVASTDGWDVNVPLDVLERSNTACSSFEGLSKIEIDIKNITVTCNNLQEIVLDK